MTSLDDLRAQSEADLAALLRKFNARQRPRVMEALRRYGSIAAIPGEFWQELEREIDQETAALMLLLLVGSYDTTARSIPGARGLVRGQFGTTTGAITSPSVRNVAAELGMKTASEYVGGIRQRLQRGIDARAGEIINLPQSQATTLVRQEIAGAMPTRATPDKIDPVDSVAITNTTNGISTGQRSAARDAEQILNAGGDGAAETPAGQTRVELHWKTERDDRVCPICAPLDGEPESVWSEKFLGGPPAHPNCRCSLSPVVTMERA